MAGLALAGLFLVCSKVTLVLKLLRALKDWHIEVNCRQVILLSLCRGFRTVKFILTEGTLVMLLFWMVLLMRRVSSVRLLLSIGWFR